MVTMAQARPTAKPADAIPPTERVETAREGEGERRREKEKEGEKGREKEREGGRERMSTSVLT